MIIAFVLLGKLLEERAKNSTSSAIKSLMGLQPKTARRVRDGQEEEVSISFLRVGDLVSVRPVRRSRWTARCLKVPLPWMRAC